MKNKAADVLYCGVREDKIKSAHPELDTGNLQIFTRMIEERYKIHVLKDVEGKAAPWTDDPILSTYRFTNVRREQDRQSKYLIDNIVNNPALSLMEKMANIILFRVFNNWDTIKDLGGPWCWGDITDSKGIKAKVKPKLLKLMEKDPKRLFWSSAYIQSGCKRAWAYPSGDYKGQKGEEKEHFTELRPFHIGAWLVQNEILESCLEAKSQEDVCEILKLLPGFAGFLAYQVFVDFTYIPEFQFSENEFTIAGPGCKRGLCKVFKDRDGMTFEECLFWLRDNLAELQPKFKPERFMTDLPEYDRVMNVMSLENCFCEFSKYLRAYNHEGRPRNKYKPYVETEEEL